MEKGGDLKVSKKTIRILVIGKNGSGKSTLINNILEEELASECHELVTVSSNKQVIEQHIKTINNTGTEVIMYDTTTTIDNNGLIREIKQNGGIGIYDIVLLCCNSLQRIDSETNSLVTILNNTYGRKLWNKTILVLTFVNMFLSLHSVRIHLADEAKEDALKQVASSLKEHIKLGTSISCFNKLPVVLAGCRDECDQVVTNNWRLNMWKCCSHLLKANDSCVDLWKLIRAQSTYDNNDSDYFKNIPREILVGATTGAFLGTAISPGMGTVLISATGAVVGGVSAVYSNRKTRRAIRIVNSITVSEDLCEQVECDYAINKSTTRADVWLCESMQKKRQPKDASSSTVIQTNHSSAEIQSSNDSSIGNFADEILQHFSILS